MKTLYLIRHGQSEANLSAAHAGWAQVPLTAQGQKDAQHAGDILSAHKQAGKFDRGSFDRGNFDKVKFDRVYTSDLLRAQQTQKIALPNAVPILSERIREINVGSLAGRLVSDCEAAYGEAYKHHRRDMDFSSYGGETYEMFCCRIREFFAEVADGSAENTAAFCHGGVIHASLDMLIGGELSNLSLPLPKVNRIDKSAFACDNCSVTVFAFRGGKWRLQTWNHTGML